MSESPGWTVERLAACFADRLSLPPALMQAISAAAFGAEPLRVSKSPRPALAALLSATGLYLAGTSLGELPAAHIARDDLLAAAIQALAAPEQGWICRVERGGVTIDVRFPASFLVYLGIVAARIAEESNVAA